MSEEPPKEHYVDDKPKDIKRALRTCIYVARKAGYRINHDAWSLAGLVIAEALKSERAKTYDFIYYCTMVFIQQLSIQKEQALHEEHNLDNFVERYPICRDSAQQLLMQIREPDRSVCFALWIEGKKVYEVQDKYDVTWSQIQKILKRTTKILLDSLAEDGHYAIRKNPGELDTLRTLSVRRHSGRKRRESDD